MRRVIAFDPSYVAGKTGYAVVEDSKLLCYGVLRPVGTADAERFASLQCEVETLCVKHDVSKGVVEKPPPFAYSRSTDEEGKPLNISSIMKNSNSATVILASLGRLGILAVEAHAHQWKKQRNYNLNKEDIKRLAERLFPHLKGKKLSSHEADAICMAALNV